MGYLTIDPDTGRRRSAIRWPNGHLRPVDGCRWCGHVSATHSLFWMPARPGHAYEPPTEAQRTAREAANQRAARPRITVNVQGGHRLPNSIDTDVLRRVRAGLENL